jgi:hypothetical protein
MLTIRRGLEDVADSEEFRPKFSDDPPEPGPMESAYLAWKKGGDAGLLKHLRKVEAERKRKNRSARASTSPKKTPAASRD